MGIIYKMALSCIGVDEVIDKIPFPSDIVEGAHRCQDPELWLVNAERLDEYLHAYRDMKFSDDGKFTLMFVILDSFNDMVSAEDTRAAGYWAEIKPLLQADALFFTELIIYYANADCGKDLEDRWAVAPHMRSILIELVKKHPYLLADYNEEFEKDWDYLPSNISHTGA